MIRPYVAIIVDSFREALASRVLWVLLGVIGLVLLVLAPCGYRDVVTIGVVESDVADWPKFIQYVRDEAARDRPSPSRQLVAQMDEKMRKTVAEFQLPTEGDFDGAMQFIRSVGQFRQELNRVIERPELYDQASWRETPIVSDELKQLLDDDPAKLLPTEIGRRNRLLLEAAYVDNLATSLPLSFQMRYFIWDLFEPLPFRPAEFRRVLDQSVAWLMGFLVGVVGVFIAIVVTSSIIPQMFDPGQLNLLLSKPVSRSLLFLAKFVGGCAFILLNASCLIVGLWLILGVRFQFWNAKLLLGIPIYLFMFAIYFTVSSLAGVLWRNAIVSIGVTVLFWLACFGLGSAKGLLDNFYVSKQRLVQLVEAKDTLVAVNEMGFAFAWEENESRWNEIFVNDMQKQLRPAMVMIPTIPAEMKPIGPAYDAERDQLVSIQRSLRNGQMQTYAGPRAEEWKSGKGSGASIGTMYLLREPDGKLLVVSSTGLFRLAGDPRQTSRPLKMFGVAIPLPTVDAYRSVGPEQPIILTRPAAAALNPDTGELALYSRGKITLLEKDGDGRFRIRLEKPLDEENSPPLTIAFAGQYLFVGRDDGKLLLLDARSGDLVKEFDVERSQAPRFVAGAPGGLWFSAVFHDGHLWLVDVANQQIRQPRVTGQGDVSAVLFRDAQRLLVADRSTRVTEYQLSDLSVQRRWAPPPTILDNAHRYVIRPLYTIFPKPGELSNTVTYLLSGKASAPASGRPRQELDVAQTQLNPWAPVWSSGAFMIVMLALGCLYLERQEF